MIKTIAVLGAGSWGTALALVLARNHLQVRLWSHESDHIAAMQRDRCNRLYLPDIAFPNNIELFSNLENCVENVNDILVAVPSHAFHHCLSLLKNSITTHVRIAWGTKGVDSTSGELLHVVFQRTLGDRPCAALSGPTLAKEVALGLPAAITLASQYPEFSNELMHALHSPTFRVYQNTDLIGVGVCGTCKNVLAISAGIADGLGLGSNARSALITRGLAEMRRLCLALGGQEATLMGLAGVGDLILTSTDNGSRNRRFGLLLGQGYSIDAARTEIGQVVEGHDNVKQVHELARRYRIDMPITETVYRVLFENLSAKEAAQSLLSRNPSSEF